MRILEGLAVFDSFKFPNSLTVTKTVSVAAVGPLARTVRETLRYLP